jgi:serine-threonine kinase receptor-associated protein
LTQRSIGLASVVAKCDLNEEALQQKHTPSANRNTSNNEIPPKAMTNAAAADAAIAAAEKLRQIPIVCPGHTRPLAELQFIDIQDELPPLDGGSTNGGGGGTVSRTLLVSACHDRKPMLRDGVTGDWIGSFVGHKGAVWSCQMDPSGSLAATASGDYSCKLWDAITGQALKVEFPHKHIVKTCVFSPNSTRLATGGKEAILRIYNLQDSLLLNKSNTAATTTTPTIAEPALEIPQASAINKVIWMSDTSLLCACADGNVYQWEIPATYPASTTTALPVTTPSHTFSTNAADEIRDMELSATLQILTVAAGTKVFFFHVTTKQLLHSYGMPIHFREEGGASLHPSGTKFVAGGSDLWIRVFDFATGQELECHKGHHGPIRCVRYAPDGKSYATGSEDGTIRLWKTDPSSAVGGGAPQ